MFDETNNTENQELELPEKLFEEDELQDNESLDGNHTEEARPSETLRIKYNGEERDISLEEARVLAQKGMNYDHVVNERDTKYKRELDFLDRMAAEQGLSRTDLMSAYDNKNAPQGETVGQAVHNASVRAREQIRRISESVGFSGAWKNLFRRYPELSRDSAYSELKESVQRGMTPLEAYQDKLIREKENALKVAENNSAAARRSVGSLEGDGGKAQLDEFLTGFYSV